LIGQPLARAATGTTVFRELLEELGFATPHEIGGPLMVTSTDTVGQVRPALPNAAVKFKILN
jgi:hypothetical protein